MKPLRVVDTGVQPARWNIAATAALAELHEARHIPDTLRFHRYPRSVLLGRNQKVAQAIHVQECHKRGVVIARRVTGGGAVYMGPGVLAWDLVLTRQAWASQLSEATPRIGAAIAAGLSRLNVTAVFREPGDITIDGRKVSGSSGLFDGATFVMQGTVLIAVDRDEMNTVLKMPPGTPVVPLSDLLDPLPALADIQAAVLAGLSDVLGPHEPGELRPEELALTQHLLAEEIGTDAFVMDEAVA
jgi:lipoate-protein ligase A